MTGLLTTSLSGLLAAQRAMETTQNNIANVNTEGYSRQRVEQVSMPDQLSGNGYIGQGVNVANIKRSYDQFVTKQLNASTSAFNEADRYQQLAANIDNLLGDATSGMSAAMDNFFNALSSVSSDPSSMAPRQVLLADADSVAQTFNMLNGRFDDMRKLNNSDIASKVESINSIAASIAKLNGQITSSLGQSQGLKQPNDLLDKRDALLTQLSAIVNVTVVPQNDGTASVFIGNGQTLVLSNKSTTFTTQPSPVDPGKLSIGVQASGGFVDLTNQMSGGSLGGAIKFRDELLDPAQQKLGQLAAGMAMELNAVHQKGFDLNGTAGTALFSFSGSIPVISSPNNTGKAVINASFQDLNANPSATANLDYSDYKLTYTGTSGAEYTLTRLRDNQVINLTMNATADPNVSTLSYASTQPVNTTIKDLPGIDLTVNINAGIPVVGDEAYIRPTYDAATRIELNITDPKKVAAATNIEVDPVTNQPVQQLDASGNPVVDAQGNPVYVTVNGPMPGDNRNVLQLAALKDKLSMLGGKATFSNAYAQIVSSVGTLTQAAKTNSTAQEAMLNQAKTAREGVAGVNLDEEAANLIRYQQAYQAAAQSVSVAKTLFDSLLGAVR